MQKLMKAMHRNEKGFTLVELMVVVVIIAILIAIAIPIYNNITRNAERSAVEANLRIIDGAVVMYFAEMTFYPPAGWEDVAGDFLTDWPEGPGGAVFSIDASQSPPRAVCNGTVGGRVLSNAMLPIVWESFPTP